METLGNVTYLTEMMQPDLGSCVQSDKQKPLCFVKLSTQIKIVFEHSGWPICTPLTHDTETQALLHTTGPTHYLPTHTDNTYQVYYFS